MDLHLPLLWQIGQLVVNEPRGLVLLRLILMGAPGSGKGTQAELLVEQFGILHISTGEMLRDAMDRRTDLGGLVEPYMALGRLVPDHHVISVVEDRLGQPDIEAGFILDGFPRTLRQVYAMDELMEGQGLTLRPLDPAALDDE